MHQRDSFNVIDKTSLLTHSEKQDKIDRNVCRRQKKNLKQEMYKI